MLEMIKWIQQITVSNILLHPENYCVKQKTVSTLTFNIHLFNFLLSMCCTPRSPLLFFLLESYNLVGFFACLADQT
jgi:hypothetical protein